MVVLEPPAPAPTTTATTARTAAGAVPFAAAGLLFVAYPVLRPWSDQTLAGEAGAFSSPLWLAAHLSAAAAFLLVGFGLLAVRDRYRTRTARLALGTWGAGAALTLTYYGAEAFALNALGPRAGADLAALTEAVRMGPVQITVFGAGLVLLAVSAVLTAVAMRPGRTAWPFAAGMVLFLPQFFADPTLRIAHGVLLGLGCLLLAARLRRG
jgi:hypothetical protein